MPRVLLVEDDPSLGRTLAERLVRDSLDVEWAQTIADAEKRLGASTWDLAILDVKLPDGSGFGLARHIKRTSTVPVMFMTAQNSAEARLEGFEIGADEYLPKPFHLKEFLIRVRHVLARHRPRRVFRCGDAPAPASQDVSNRYRPISISSKPFVWPHFTGLPALFQTTPTSFPEQRDQTHHLLIFLRRVSILKPAKPPIDSLHRHLCRFGEGVAGRSTLSDMEPVTTFSGE